MKLKKKNVITVPELHATVKESYTPTPESRDVQWIFDISGWLAPHIAQIKNHVYPHAFKFFLGDDKRAKMIYKNWAQDKTWQPIDKPITLLTTKPQGIPALVRPILGGKEPMKLTDLSSKIKAGSHRMTEEQLRWWTNFVREEETSRERWTGYTAEQMERLANEHWYLINLKSHKAAPAQEPADLERHEEELQRLLGKEKTFKPVSVTGVLRFRSYE